MLQAELLVSTEPSALCHDFQVKARNGPTWHMILPLKYKKGAGSMKNESWLWRLSLVVEFGKLLRRSYRK